MNVCILGIGLSKHFSTHTKLKKGTSEHVHFRYRFFFKVVFDTYKKEKERGERGHFRCRFS